MSASPPVFSRTTRSRRRNDFPKSESDQTPLHNTRDDIQHTSVTLEPQNYKVDIDSSDDDSKYKSRLKIRRKDSDDDSDWEPSPKSRPRRPLGSVQKNDMIDSSSENSDVQNDDDSDYDGHDDDNDIEEEEDGEDGGEQEDDDEEEEEEEPVQVKESKSKSTKTTPTNKDQSGHFKDSKNSKITQQLIVTEKDKKSQKSNSSGKDDKDVEIVLSKQVDTSSHHKNNKSDKKDKSEKKEKKSSHHSKDKKDKRDKKDKKESKKSSKSHKHEILDLDESKTDSVQTISADTILPPTLDVETKKGQLEQTNKQKDVPAENGDDEDTTMSIGDLFSDDNLEEDSQYHNESAFDDDHDEDDDGDDNSNNNNNNGFNSRAPSGSYEDSNTSTLGIVRQKRKRLSRSELGRKAISSRWAKKAEQKSELNSTEPLLPHLTNYDLIRQFTVLRALQFSPETHPDFIEPHLDNLDQFVIISISDLGELGEIFQSCLKYIEQNGETIRNRPTAHSHMCTLCNSTLSKRDAVGHVANHRATLVEDKERLSAEKALEEQRLQQQAAVAKERAAKAVAKATEAAKKAQRAVQLAERALARSAAGPGQYDGDEDDEIISDVDTDPDAVEAVTTSPKPIPTKPDTIKTKSPIPTSPKITTTTTKSPSTDDVHIDNNKDSSSEKLQKAKPKTETTAIVKPKVNNNKKDLTDPSEIEKSFVSLRQPPPVVTLPNTTPVPILNPNFISTRTGRTIHRPVIVEVDDDEEEQLPRNAKRQRQNASAPTTTTTSTTTTAANNSVTKPTVTPANPNIQLKSLVPPSSTATKLPPQTNISYHYPSNPPTSTLQSSTIPPPPPLSTTLPLRLGTHPSGNGLQSPPPIPTTYGQPQYSSTHPPQPHSLYPPHPTMTPGQPPTSQYSHYPPYNNYPPPQPPPAYPHQYQPPPPPSLPHNQHQSQDTPLPKTYVTPPPVLTTPGQPSSTQDFGPFFF